MQNLLSIALKFQTKMNIVVFKFYFIILATKVSWQQKLMVTGFRQFMFFTPLVYLVKSLLRAYISSTVCFYLTAVDSDVLFGGWDISMFSRLASPS